MPVQCGSLPKQTATITDNSPLQAADQAQTIARVEAAKACASEKCDKGTCGYTETKVTGKTWYDPKTKKWTSAQTSSGKCSCVDESEQVPCKREIEQLVQNYGDGLGAADKAREIARRIAQQACSDGKCEQPKGTQPNKCIYEEASIEGHTWKDAATGKYICNQTSTGKCKCEKRWL